jgi:hypothetical protein
MTTILKINDFGSIQNSNDYSNGNSPLSSLNINLFPFNPIEAPSID